MSPNLPSPSSSDGQVVVDATKRDKRATRFSGIIKREEQSDSLPAYQGYIIAIVIVIICVLIACFIWWLCDRRQRRQRQLARANTSRVNILNNNAESEPRTSAGTGYTTNEQQPAIELHDLPLRTYHVEGYRGGPSSQRGGASRIVAEHLTVPTRTDHLDGGRTQLPTSRNTRPAQQPSASLPAFHDGTPESSASASASLRVVVVPPTIPDADEEESDDEPTRIRKKIQRAETRRKVAAREMELREAAQRGDLQRYREAEEEATEPITQSAIDTYGLGGSSVTATTEVTGVTGETGGTGPGTVISDDPWLEEVLENRRRAHARERAQRREGS
ncbi:MAG: hypothetical protein M1823_006044 [Watsoniomyces obsoletus]|nr:MAG: hypothetical protein M1823_006044 [Watsoniomyces obsoletus]